MNILTELLPGARQIRTPLAVGYLWLLVAWVNVARVPHRFQNSTLATRASVDLHHMSPAIAAIVVSFVAYLLGLFFEQADEMAVQLAKGCLFIGSAALPLALMVLSFALYFITVPAALCALAIMHLYAKRYQISIKRAAGQIALNVMLVILNNTGWAMDIALKVWSPLKPVKDDLVAGKLVQLMDENPDLMKQFCETLRILELRIACREAGLKSATPPGPIPSAKDEHIINLKKAALRSSIDACSERLLREYLYGRLEVSYEVRRAVLLKVMEKAEMQKLVNRAIDDATARIQAGNLALFENYDRLKSEGEFRRGVAVPLGAALCSVCSIYVSQPLWILTAGLPMLFVYFSGMRKQEEACRVQASWINAGIAGVSLEAKDKRMLQWPSKGSAPSVPLATSRSWEHFRARVLSRSNGSHESESGSDSSIQPESIMTSPESRDLK